MGENQVDENCLFESFKKSQLALNRMYHYWKELDELIGSESWSVLEQ